MVWYYKKMYFGLKDWTYLMRVFSVFSKTDISIAMYFGQVKTNRLDRAWQVQLS